ncbi:MAG: ABC transporter ATP-binding protein [Nitrolancea sp.]
MNRQPPADMPETAASLGETVDGRNVNYPVPEAMIEVDRLSKWYGDVVAVSEVSFSVDPGVTALLGPNGAGKSSILKTLSGLLKPSTGTVRIDGTIVRSSTDVYGKIGVVPEAETVYPFLTGREFVHWNAVMHRLPDASEATERALKTADLGDAASRQVGGYSKGMRQRIKVAAALVHDPDVLILDEPLTGTDPVQRVHLINLIRGLGESGKTVLVSSHVLHEVERVADRIIVIVDGKLAAVGDFRAIRDKIDEHARTVRLRASNNRTLASLLFNAPEVTSIRLEPDRDAIVVESRDVRALYQLVPRIAKENGLRLLEVAAVDDSLASVFAYVTERR